MYVRKTYKGEEEAAPDMVYRRRAPEPERKTTARAMVPLLHVPGAADEWDPPTLSLDLPSNKQLFEESSQSEVLPNLPGPS